MSKANGFSVELNKTLETVEDRSEKNSYTTCSKVDSTRNNHNI